MIIHFASREQILKLVLVFGKRNGDAIDVPLWLKIMLETVQKESNIHSVTNALTRNEEGHRQ